MSEKTKRMYSQAEIRKMIDANTEKAVRKTLILASSWLMDELNYEPDKIVEFWKGCSRYAEYNKDHLISMQKICDIIKEHTGMELHWN